MNVYTLPDGTIVLVTDQFQIGDEKYPPGWLGNAAPADISAAGIKVTTGPDPAVVAGPVSSLAFRQLFTAAERLAITTAGETVPQIREFMDDESSTPSVSLSDPEVIAGIAALVTAGLLTQDRATAILTGSQPPSASD
jgi:hypothetical protein